MALLPEWNSFGAGVVLGLIGALVLLVMYLLRRKMLGKAPVRISPRALGISALAVAGALILGLGMCMVMVWNLLVPGVIVGIVGIVVLLFLIPAIKGLED